MIFKSAEEIVDFLLKKPFEEFNINQISRGSETNLSTVFNSLKDLEKNEVLVSHKRANSLFFKLNLSDLVCQKFCELIFAGKTKEVLKDNELKVFVKDLIEIIEGRIEIMLLLVSESRVSVFGLSTSEGITKTNDTLKKASSLHLPNKRVNFDVIPKNEFLQSVFDKSGNSFDIYNSAVVIKGFSNLLRDFSDIYKRINRRFSL